MKTTREAEHDDARTPANPSLMGPTTQLTPDDILAEEGPVAPAGEDGGISAEQLEQDVVSINPSVDSMESRG